MNRLITFAILFLIVPLSGCDTKPDAPAGKFDAIIQVEVKSVTPRTGNYVGVAYKVTNKSATHIVRVRAVVTVLDAAGTELGSRQGHYIVRSGGVDPAGGGGLAPGASEEHQTLVTVKDPAKAASAKIAIEFVRQGSGAKIGADEGGEKEDAK